MEAHAAGAVAHLEYNAFLFRDLEPRRFGLHVVMAYASVWQHILARFICCNGVHYARFRVRRGDFGVRDHRARRIGNRADNRCLLRECVN